MCRADDGDDARPQGVRCRRATAYTYPTSVRRVFGTLLVFDRSTGKQGQPVLGTEPIANATANATC